MCGIIGYARIDYDKVHADLVCALVKESSIRGLHAFGYSSYNTVLGGDIQTVKDFSVPSDSKLLDVIDRNDLFLFHNRYSTSGNWEDHNNNMPISNGHLSLAANCVISQKTKQEMEKEFGITMATENDTEVVWQKLWKEEDIVEFLRSITGSFAGCWVRNGKLHFVRNNKRPLHYFIYMGALFVVSTHDIAVRAFRRLGIQTDVNIVSPFKIYTS